MASWHGRHTSASLAAHIQASSHLRHLAARKLFLPPKLGSPATNPFIEHIESCPLHNAARATARARLCIFCGLLGLACLCKTGLRLVTVQDSLICDLCSGLHLHVYMGMCLCLHTYLHQSSQPSDHPCVLYIHRHQRICRSIHLLADTR